MKATWLGCLCVLASVLLWAGCGKKVQEKPAPGTQQEKPATEEAAKPGFPQQKEELMVAIGKRIDQLERELKELGEAAQQKGEEAKAEYEKMKPGLEKKLDAMKKQLESAKTSAGEVWEGMKVKLSQGIESLEKEFSKATSKVEQKPEPPEKPKSE